MKRIAMMLVVLAGCEQTLEVRDPPVVIGVLAPRTGTLAETGTMMEELATLAAAEINAAGGIDGRRLVVRVTDIGDDSDVAAEFDALVEGGAVAVVGPAQQDQVLSVVPRAVAAETVFVSPISTTPWRRGARPDDDGYMMRVVANDELQTLALAYYLRSVDPERPTSATVVAESACDCGTASCNPTGEGDFPTEQALGVADYFGCLFTNPADGVVRQVNTTRQLFTRNLTDAALTNVISNLNTIEPPPRVVVLAGLEQDALRIIGRWVEDHPNAVTDPQIRWLTTATTKTPGFAANMPAEVYADVEVGDQPVAGSAPTSPAVGRAYRTLERAHRAAYGREVADRAFAPNVWDAVYLLAAGLTAQSVRGEALGGPVLRDAVRAVSSGGPILHAGSWIDLTTILRAGGDVDYDGASGPVDLDGSSEVIGPYEIWEVRPQAGGGFAFERVVYIDARNLGAVLSTFGLGAGATVSELVAACAIPPANVCP